MPLFLLKGGELIKRNSFALGQVEITFLPEKHRKFFLLPELCRGQAAQAHHFNTVVAPPAHLQFQPHPLLLLLPTLT